MKATVSNPRRFCNQKGQKSFLHEPSNFDSLSAKRKKSMGTSSKALAQKLKNVAASQHGCFTAAQAIEVGYADSVHLYHVKTGSWVRLFWGVYRFSDLPETPAARCMAALLWSRDKTGKVLGILSAETASLLQADCLTSSMPVQICVPKGFRRTSATPKGIVVFIMDTKALKTSKIKKMPAQPFKPKKKETPEKAGTAAAGRMESGMDIADYYDLLDYQAVKQTD